MYAVEFKAKIKNGLIKIPQKYLGKFKDRVKVILLEDDEKQIKTEYNMIDQLLKSPLKIKSFKPFTREEMYD